MILTEGLNILTGETGAGKSMVIGSVNVAPGLAGFKGFAREDAALPWRSLFFRVDNERQRKALKVPRYSDGGRSDYHQPSV
ncbi:MAG: hypothetical protein ACLR2E_16970 [Lachnospiraceae bacterium]